MDFDPEAVRTFEFTRWQQAAAAYESSFATATRQFVDPLLDAAGVHNGIELLDVACGKFAAEAAKFCRRNFAFSPEFFFDLGFDGEAVAVPTRDVRGVMARHGFRFDDEVFEDFV